MNWIDCEPFILTEILILLGIGILLAILASLPRRFVLGRYCQFALYGAELGMILSVLMLAMTAGLLQQQGALIHFWTQSGRFVQWIVLLTPSEGGLTGVLCGIALARIKQDRNKTEAIPCN